MLLSQAAAVLTLLPRVWILTALNTGECSEHKRGTPTSDGAPVPTALLWHRAVVCKRQASLNFPE